MSKDYAKTRATRKRKPVIKSSKRSVNITWLIIAILIASLIFGLNYLKRQVTNTVHPEKLLPIDVINKNNSSSKDKTISSEEEKVNFDFYTLLPKDKNQSIENKKSIDTSESLNKKPQTTTLTTLNTPEITPKEVRNKEKDLLTPPSSANSDVEKKSKQSISEEIKVENKAIHNSEKKKEIIAPNKSIEHKKNEVTLPEIDIKKPIKQPKNLLPKKPIIKEELKNAYLLQIGAFRKDDDANRLKAQLNLAGYEAKVKAIVINGVTWYRVWIGPYANNEAALKIQKELQTKHTKSIIVKMK
ncbi:MAG: Cell division protein FtsN [Legionellaceae bacterium]